MRGLSLRSLGIVAVAGLFAFACGSSGGGTGGNNANKGTIKIGVDLPESGSEASDGIPTLHGIQYAVDQAGSIDGFKLAVDNHDDAPAGQSAFHRQTDAVQRCADAGRFRQAQPLDTLGWAVQLWTMRHGMVSLVLAGLLPTEHVRLHFEDMSVRLYIGYGDNPDAARQSVAAALRNPPAALTPESRRTSETST